MSDLDVLILAAGKGERLRPLTNLVPKPLVPFLGFPILAYCIEKVLPLNPRRVFLNGHHLKQQIEAFTRNCHEQSWGPEFIFLDEPDLLGTGGTIKGIFETFSPKNLLIHNGDLIHDIHVSHVSQLPESGVVAWSLMTIGHVAQSTPVYVRDGLITSFGNAGLSSTKHTFSGIYIINDQLVPFFPREKTFSIIDSLKTAMANGLKVTASFPDPTASWFDLGTGQSWLSAQQDVLRSPSKLKGIGFYDLVKRKNARTLFVGANETIEENGVRYVGPSLLVNAVVEGHGVIGPNVCISNLELHSSTFEVANATVGGIDAANSTGEFRVRDQICLANKSGTTILQV